MKLTVRVFIFIACFFALNSSSFADSVTLKAIVAKPASAGAGLPKTGAPLVSRTPVAGEDGSPTNNAGVSMAFTDNNDNTITDNVTHLMWIKDPSVPAVGMGSAVAWSAALTAVQTLNNAAYLGHTDWRLPNIKELMSIMDYGKQPTINTQYFAYELGSYWSSTVSPNNTIYKMLGSFIQGTIIDNRLSTTSKYYIRPVRSITTP